MVAALLLRRTRDAVLGRGWNTAGTLHWIRSERCAVLVGLVALLVCQLVGEVVARALDLPVPGPVVGMLVFFVVLQVRRPAHESGLVRAPQTLLRHLPLLYVPVGVGVVAYLSVLGASVVPVGLGLVVSWLVGLLVTAAVTALLLRLTGQKRVAR